METPDTPERPAGDDDQAPDSGVWDNMLERAKAVARAMEERLQRTLGGADPGKPPASPPDVPTSPMSG